MNVVNPYDYGTQKYRILELLRLGPVTNRDMVQGLSVYKYTGRIFEIREDLKFQDLDITVKPLGGGLYEYRIARAQGELF